MFRVLKRTLLLSESSLDSHAILLGLSRNGSINSDFFSLEKLYMFTLFILMDFSSYVDRISMEFPILYFNWSQIVMSKFIIHFCHEEWFLSCKQCRPQ